MPEPPQVAAAHPHVLSIIIDPHPDPLPAPCLSSRRQPLELASRCAPLPVITRFDNFHGRLPPCPPITISRPASSPKFRSIKIQDMPGRFAYPFARWRTYPFCLVNGHEN